MINKELHYQPKESMCAVCTHRIDDCSGLPFDEMKKINKVDINGIIIVKCFAFCKGSYPQGE